MEDNGIFVGLGGGRPLRLLLRQANRHGLIAGATGTGKTVTLQNLAEGFSAAGVPVFLADVKGDLAGMAMPGSPAAPIHEALARRAAEVGLADFIYAGNSVVFWDLFGQQGHPIRTTISEMGPLLLARLMGLNEVQEGVLNIAFRVADEQGLLLLNLDDLRSMLVFCGENAEALTTRYGNVAKATIGAIQRQLLELEAQGGAAFFGEPALAITDFMLLDAEGRGNINILAADKLMASPKLYATFLLWLLSELFEDLPEVGDPDKPKLVFFFDEAHLLFDEAPAGLVEKIEQVVRLVRSKGVGVYFITQNPIDVPESVAGQLGNRIQHALRAYTPREQRAIKAAAETFRINPDLDVENVISELRTGEALVSLLDADGAPTPVERTLIRPPRSRIGPLQAQERTILVASSPLAGKYETISDRESAHELLKARAEQAAAEAAQRQAAADAAKARAQAEREQAKLQREHERLEREARRNPPMHEAIARQFGRTVQRQVINRAAGALVRGILGGLFRGR